MSNKGIEDLNGFFDKTHNFFEELLENQDYFLDKTLQDSAQKSQQELMPIFNKLKAEVMSVDDGRLIQAGLSGKQLIFKLDSINFFVLKQYFRQFSCRYSPIITEAFENRGDFLASQLQP